MKSQDTLKKTIAALRFDYTNPDIEKHFEYETPRSDDYRLFYFDCETTSEDAIREMERCSYSPATLSELLAYAKDEWNDSDWVFALGSVAKVDLSRRVPCLGRDRSGRGLYLGFWSVRWDRYCRFLAIRVGTPVDKSQQAAVECKHDINYCPSCGAKIR